MFEYKITLNDDDYFAFNQYHTLNSAVGKKNLLFFKLFVPFICFMVVIIFLIAGSDLLLVLIEAIAMAILSILWFCFSKKIILNSMKKSITKMKKDGRLPYNQEAILKFDDEYIHEITPLTENKTSYSLVEKITAAEKAVYIYISSVQAHILPFTVFSDEMEKQKFLEFIHSKADHLKNPK